MGGHAQGTVPIVTLCTCTLFCTVIMCMIGSAPEPASTFRTSIATSLHTGVVYMLGVVYMQVTIFVFCDAFEL